MSQRSRISHKAFKFLQGTLDGSTHCKKNMEQNLPFGWIIADILMVLHLKNILLLADIFLGYSRLQTKLREGNVFTGVCPIKGVCLPAMPLDRQISLRRQTPTQIRSTGGQYPSKWNAYLLLFKFSN